MASITYSPKALSDLERIVDHLREASPRAARNVTSLIVEAVEILERHPLIGRAIRGEIRALVISRGKSGYVALYRLRSQRIEILAIRHQREAGFP